MIFTSYYANKGIQEFDNLTSISIFPPKWFKEIPNYKTLAPTKELLLDYKKNPDKNNYTKTFIKQLSMLDVKETYKELDGKVLLCYEKTEDFCHRKLVNKWFNSNGLLALEYKEKYRIAVVGSRTFTNYAQLKTVLDEIVLPMLEIGIEVVIVSGGANGADNLAEKYAYENKLEVLLFIPDWDTHGKAAGMIRNSDIVNASDLGVAFWDGKSTGTANTLQRLIRKCLPIILLRNTDKFIFDNVKLS